MLDVQDGTANRWRAAWNKLERYENLADDYAPEKVLF